MRWKAAEVGTFFVLYDFVGEGNRDGPVGFFIVRLIGTATVVTRAADAEIVVTDDGGDAASANLPDDFVGPNIVANEVAEAVDGVGPLLFDIFKEGIEGREVGMDVGK